MKQLMAGLESQRNQAPVYTPVLPFYFIEGLSAHAATLLMVGVFFYTHRMFQWGISQNLLLACGQGACYVGGAILTGWISGRLGRRNLLFTLQVILVLLALAAVIWPTATVIVIVLLLYSGFCAAGWPLLESLVSEGADSEVLFKRLTTYNLVWSGLNAVTLAISGTVIQRWSTGLFVLPALAHGTAACLVRFSGRSAIPTPPVSLPHAQPEPELLHLRTLAMWLSRISLPATYIVAYSLAAMMPSLPVIHSLDTQAKTLVSAVWFVARWGTFLALGTTTFWHTRPRLMLVAAAIMLLAFLGTTMRPSDLLPAAHFSLEIDLSSMIVWQVLLGAAMGIIYSASLYFGMVLSAGSTEHGGYHEALIGVGSVLGPGAAFVAHHLQPEGIGLSVATVAGLVALSLFAAVAASMMATRRKSRDQPV